MPNQLTVDDVKAPTVDELHEALERLTLLEKAIGLSAFDHLPVISKENRGQFQADLRIVLAQLGKAAPLLEAGYAYRRARFAEDATKQRQALLAAALALPDQGEG